MLLTINDLRKLWTLKKVQTYKILKKQGWSTKTIIVDGDGNPVTKTEAKKVHNGKKSS